MAKTIRFGDLVRDSGRPKTVTLWSKPEDSPPFARAIKENRVLTVLQETGRKDHGMIGFKLLPGALYLEFPRALPHADDAVVVGINYQLIDEPTVAAKDRAKPAKPSPVRPKPESTLLQIKEPEPAVKKPEPQEFTIKVRRTAVVEDDITVKALDRAEAERLAVERVKHKAFKPGNEVVVEIVQHRE